MVSDRSAIPAPQPTPRPSALDGVTVRPVEDGDLEFLLRVYAASRDREMALVSHWSQTEKETFLQDQFRLQHSHYQTHYPNARYQIILKNAEAIGRLYVAAMKNEIRLMDIALLPEHRNLGIGGALMERLMGEAIESNRFVSLHVEEENPAKHLYLRQGFVDAGEVSFYTLMHWVPAGITPVFEHRSSD